MGNLKEAIAVILAVLVAHDRGYSADTVVQEEAKRRGVPVEQVEIETLKQANAYLTERNQKVV